MGEAPFVRECRTALRNLPGSSDLLRPRKELYQDLVVSSASDPLSEQRGWTTEEVCCHCNWATSSCFLYNSEFSLTWRLTRNALPLFSLNFRASLADIPNCTRLKKQLSTPSTIANKFARSGITSRSSQLVSNPSSSCCSTLVTSWTTFYFRERSV